jgi:hypothetical protein
MLIVGPIVELGNVPRRPNLPYADAPMKDVVLALLHLAAMGAKPSHRGGVRAVVVSKGDPGNGAPGGGTSLEVSR